MKTHTNFSASDHMRPLRTGIYPGTFDPVTKGHLHLIRRASCLVDHLIIGVADNARKGPSFSITQRVQMVETDIRNMEHLYEAGCKIDVMPFQGLLVSFAAQVGASCVIRGLRAVSDFEYEFQLTGMNAKLDPKLETLFLMASDEWQFVSSSFVKEIASMGGDVSRFVTPAVADILKNRSFES